MSDTVTFFNELKYIGTQFTFSWLHSRQALFFWKWQHLTQWQSFSENDFTFIGSGSHMYNWQQLATWVKEVTLHFSVETSICLY